MAVNAALQRRRIVAALQYLLGLGLGLGLFYVLFAGLDWRQLGSRLTQVHPLWLGAGLVAMLLAHALRALRWQQLLAGAGAPAHLGPAFAALMVGYTVNYAVPRAGEITRCTLLLRAQGVPLPTAIGTVVTERLLDVLVLLVLLVGLVALEADTVARLLAGWQNVDATRVLLGIGVAGVLAVGGAVLLWRLRHRLPAQGLVQRLEHFLTALVEAIVSIRRVPNPWAVALQTVLIWACYGLNTWLVLRALPDFGQASVYFGFFLTALGAVGMAVPVPGGIGSVHGLMLLGALVKGYSEAAGQAAALVLHSSSLVLNVLVGVGGLLWLLSRPAQGAARADAGPGAA